MHVLSLERFGNLSSAHRSHTYRTQVNIFNGFVFGDHICDARSPDIANTVCSQGQIRQTAAQ